MVFITALAFVLVASVSATSIKMDVFTSGSCIADTYVQEISVNLGNQPANVQPSCNEVFTAFGIPGATRPICLGYPLTVSAFQLVQKYNLFQVGGTTSNNFYLINITGFQITSCTENGALMQLQREDKEYTDEEISDCFYLEGKTNASAIEEFQDFVNMQFSLSYTIQLSATQSPQYILSASSLTTRTGSNTWSFNSTASGLSEIVIIPGGGGAQTTTYILDPNVSLNRPILFNYQSGGAKLIADKVKITLNPGSSFVDKVTVALVRDFYPFNPFFVPTCNMTYDIVYVSGGRDWGQFFKVKAVSAKESNIVRQNVGRTFSSPFNYVIQDMDFCSQILEFQNAKCLDKCSVDITITTIDNCQNNYRSCTSYPPIVSAVSNYQGTDCLCGDMLESMSFASYFGSNFRAHGTVLYGTYSGITTATCSANYSLNSGNLFALSAGYEDPVSQELSTGAIVGAVAAFFIVIVLFALFAIVVKDLPIRIGQMLLKRFITPLGGVQKLVLIITACCAIGAISTTTVVVSQRSQQSIGIFYFFSSTGLTNTPEAEAYSCSAYIHNENYDYVFSTSDACTTVRGASVVSAFTSVTGTIFLFYNYGYMALVMIICGVLSSIIAIGVTQSQLIDGYFLEFGQSMEIETGNSFNLMVAVVVMFVCALFAWIIDFISSETLDDVFSGTPKSTYKPSKTKKTKSKETVYEDSSYEDVKSTNTDPRDTQPTVINDYVDDMPQEDPLYEAPPK